LPNLYKLKPYR